MQIELKKSEINIIKGALRDCATLYEHDCWLAYKKDDFMHTFNDGTKRKIELEIKFWEYKKSYKISQLKKLAEIEHRIVEEQVKKGWLKKILGNLQCWSSWTTTDKNWKKTRFAKYSLKIK
tara:strand:- start:224 stop:586 length:363 start_codon:yes stop_codon:yes gene_type:complete